MQNATDLQELSTRIAESITRTIAAAREAGHISNDGVVVNLAGIVQGVGRPRLDFVRRTRCSPCMRMLINAGHFSHLEISTTA
jgi:hypothetical protein